jgi:hypothetical protein
MKTAATALIIFLSLSWVAQSHAEEHFVYRDRDGNLVISNRPPPAGSVVLKKLDLIDGKQPGEDRDTIPKPRRSLRGQVISPVTVCPCHSHLFQFQIKSSFPALLFQVRRYPETLPALPLQNHTSES